MTDEQLRRVQGALQDAERWTAKFIADNYEKAEPGMPYHRALRALANIKRIYDEIGRLPR